MSHPLFYFSNLISTDLTSFFNSLPAIVGAVGGMLGLWTFIDSYLRKFNPKIYVGTKVIFNTKYERSSHRLNSIICSLEICNHRKKYGVVYDFAVRIYNTNKVNPDDITYFASEKLESIPMKTDELKNKEITSFNPITVLPSSNKSENIIFSEVIHRSKANINPNDSFKMDMYYQKKPKGKWYLIDTFYLFNKGKYVFDLSSNKGAEEPDKEGNKFIVFSALDTDVSREKIKDSIVRIKTGKWTSASHKVLKMRLLRWRYNLLKKPLYRVRDVLISVPFFLHLWSIRLIDIFIRIPIINKYGKSIRKGSLQIGDKKLRKVTDSSYEKIYTELNKLIEKINKGASDEAKINIKKSEGEIILSRYKLSIKVYKPGDTSIYVHDFNDNRLSFKMNLRSKLFNKHYWKLDNYGFITIKSFTVKLLDTFIIHSNY